jgi:hypothetical protein
VRFFGALVVIGAALALMYAPLMAGGQMSLSQAHGLCNSQLGQFVQAASGNLRVSCGTAGVGWWLVLLLAGIGLIVLAREIWQALT